MSRIADICKDCKHRNKSSMEYPCNLCNPDDNFYSQENTMDFDFEELKKQMVPYFVQCIKNNDDYSGYDFYRFCGVPEEQLGQGYFNNFTWTSLMLTLDVDLCYRIADAT